MSFSGSGCFDKLVKQENEFFTKQFIAPVLRGKLVRVSIVGVVHQFQITPSKNFQGWGVFQPYSYKAARFIRPVSMSEKREYLKLFPKLRLTLCRKVDDQWFGIPSNQSDKRFKINGLVPVALTEESQMFDSVVSRFDGTTCWFESLDSTKAFKISGELRTALKVLIPPESLEFAFLSQEQRDAYQLAYISALASDLEAKKDKQEERIKEALQRAGARYQSYLERGDTYTIEYLVGTENHRSTVDKNSLNVLSAGICLSGTDKAFDLQSLVGVIREGQTKRKIVRVTENSNIDEDNY